MFLNFSFSRCFFIGIVFLGFIRGMMYANFMPPWGIIDEEQHLDYIKRIAEDHSVPIVGKTLLSPEIVQNLFDTHRWDTFLWPTPTSSTPKDMWLEIYSYEGYQPPLYYLLLAPFYAVIPDSVILKLFLLRWITVLLSLVTVIIAIFWTRDLFPRQTYLPFMVGLILVLIPERTMATSRVNNDALLEVFGAAFLWMATRSILFGLTIRRSIWIALLLGLGILTKVSMGALALVLIFVIWQNRHAKKLLASGLWLGGIVCLLVLPFVLYNLVTYGDLTGLAGFKRLLEVVGGLPTPPLTGHTFLITLRDAFQNFWVIWWKQASVGTNIYLDVMYIILGMATILSAVGIIRNFFLDKIKIKRVSWQILASYLALIGIFLITVLMSYFSGKDNGIIQEPEIQGRFFLPVIVPIIILFVFGISLLPRWKWHITLLTIITLISADSLNLFGNLLRQFYFWAWFYQNGQPNAFVQPSFQQGLTLFFTRFWMDKPASLHPIIYSILPIYILTLAGLIFISWKYRLALRSDPTEERN